MFTSVSSCRRWRARPFTPVPRLHLRSAQGPANSLEADWDGVGAAGGKGKGAAAGSMSAELCRTQPRPKEVLRQTPGLTQFVTQDGFSWCMKRAVDRAWETRPSCAVNLMTLAAGLGCVTASAPGATARNCMLPSSAVCPFDARNGCYGSAFGGGDRRALAASEKPHRDRPMGLGGSQD